MKRKFVSLLAATALLVTSALPAFAAVTPGEKSDNYLLHTWRRATWGTGDVRSNDGDYSTRANHENRPAGNVNEVSFDLLTASEDPTENEKFVPRDEVPPYNKIVFETGTWNTNTLTVYHGTALDPNKQEKIPSPSWSEARHIGSSSTTNPNAPKREVFSFDTTTDRYIGYGNEYLETATNGGTSPFYLTEIECYYVTPNAVEITGNSQYNVVPGDSVALVGKVLDIDGDEILDSTMNGLNWSISGSDQVSIDPDTGVLSIGGGFTGEASVTVTATSTTEGCESVSTSRELTIVNARENNLPVGVEIQAEEFYAVERGTQISITGGAIDADGEVMDDPEFVVAWSVESDFKDLTIDSGVVTVNSDVAAIYEVTVTATLTRDTYTFSDSVTFQIQSAKKSENFNLRTAAVSNWTSDLKNTNDGNYATSANGGNHSAGNWRWTYDLTDRADLRYNKIKVFYTQYNTATLSASHGSSRTAGGDQLETAKDNWTEQRTLNYDHYNTGSVPMEQVFSFDATTHRYIALDNRYLHATDDASDEYYYGKNPTITEVEVYYVTPAGVAIYAEDAYSIQDTKTVSLKGAVIDVDGDAILDSEFSGLEWSLVSASGKISIDSASGVITVADDFTGSEMVTVTARMINGDYDYSAEKEIEFTASQVAAVEIVDLPDFIMTNQLQDGTEATLYPSAKIYGFSGEELSQITEEWSLAEPVQGVEIDERLGALTISGAVVADSITVQCQADGVLAQKTVLLNEKVNLAKNKVAWTSSGFQNPSQDPGTTVSMALDEDPSTYWNPGFRSVNNDVLLMDLGEETSANYFYASINDETNSTYTRVAASNTLVNRINSSQEMDPPTETDKDYAWNGNTAYPVLAPYGGAIDQMGTTLWTGQSVGGSGYNNHVGENTITSKEFGGYLDTEGASYRYWSFFNRRMRPTTVDDPWRMYEFGLYNTAPNYVQIDLPQDTAITEGSVQVNLSAKMFNGVEEEAKDGTGTWSVNGIFTIDPQSGVLTVPAAQTYPLRTITYSYESDRLDAQAQIYVWAENGTLKFANNLEEYLGISVGSGMRLEGNTLYVPQGTTAEQILAEATHTRGDVVFTVTNADYEDVTGPVEEGNLFTYEYDGNYTDFTIRFIIQDPIELAGEEGVYTASVETDEQGAVLIIAEYAQGRLVQVSYVEKQAQQPLQVSLQDVAEGNLVKAMLLESMDTLRPLTAAAVNQ